MKQPIHLDACAILVVVHKSSFYEIDRVDFIVPPEWYQLCEMPCYGHEIYCLWHTFLKPQTGGDM